MKMFLMISLALLSLSVFAQKTSAKLTPSAATVSGPGKNTSEADLSFFSLAHLKSHFKINYFSETLGPTIKKWDDNEYLDDGRRDRVPMTMYHSFSARYLVTEKFNLFVSPRFSTVIGDRNDLKDNMEQKNVYMDDWQLGIFYTFYKTNTFQYAQRFTHREPFSRKSRNELIESQVEWQHDITWAVTPAMRIIFWNNYRYYAYNSESPWERYRINFRTLFNYSLNDKWLIQYMHELDLQHSNPKDKAASKHRDMNFIKPYHDYSSFGVGYSPIRDLTFIPFIRLLDNKNIRNETTIVGLTILGKVL